LKTLAPITLDRATLYCGNSRDVLPSLEPEQFTACVCDPPYHLTQAKSGSKGFMGKTWDGGDVAFRPEFWAEVLRVLKPGAMLLAFGGTRTFHRLTCAIEDAGFEIRDCLMWLYGSGFPKSLDVSKAIDADACRAELTERLGRKPTKEEFKAAWEGFRKVVGSKTGLPGYSLNQSDHPGGVAMSGNIDNSLRNPEKECAITVPATELAKRWDGWGSSLKPAWEPIVLAMKPLDGTFAKNAIKHGVTGLAIDRCRVGDVSLWQTPGGEIVNCAQKGRWPANVLLDEPTAKLLDGQSGTSVSRQGKPRASGRPGRGYGMTHTGAEYNDSGGASRFFYCTKANKRDRTCDGRVENKHPTVKPRSLMEYLCRLVTPPGGGIILDPFMGSGSTGIGALLTGNRFVGIELEPESFETSQRRIETI